MTYILQENLNLGKGENCHSSHETKEQAIACANFNAIRLGGEWFIFECGEIKHFKLVYSINVKKYEK